MDGCGWNSYGYGVHTSEVCIKMADVDSFVYTRETLLDRITLFDAGGVIGTKSHLEFLRVLERCDESQMMRSWTTS
eukprot:scaffold91450_cov41-Cyclotella_meneghiniana.AAC.1